MGREKAGDSRPTAISGFEIERNMQRDREVNQQLQEMGYTVFRFWVQEIKNNLSTCVNDVLMYIETYPKRYDWTLQASQPTNHYFQLMSKMAADHGALNLSQRLPQFPSDPVLLEAVAKAMRDGYNQYAPMQAI